MAIQELEDRIAEVMERDQVNVGRSYRQEEELMAFWRHRLEELGWPDLAGGATGTAVNTGDIITAAKMNLKQETGTALANLGVVDQSGAGSFELRIVASETMTAIRNLTVIVNDAPRTINLTGNLTLAASLTTATAAITLTANAAGSSVTLPAAGTLATLAGAENLTNKTITAATLSGTFPGSVTFSGATITFTGTAITLTGGAAFTIRTSDAFVLNLGANGGNRLAMSTSLGDLTVYQLTANYTLRFSDPAAGRIITFADPLGNDSVVYLAATQTLTNKTLTTPTITTAAFSGTQTGTPTFSGATITFTGGTIALTAGAAYALGTTDAFELTLRANGASRLGISNTVGRLVVYSTTANYTINFADPGAGRVITVPDPGGADSLCFIAATQNLSNKTFITSPLNFTVGAAVTIGTTDANTFAIKTGNATRWTWAAASANVTLAGAASIAAPAATAAALNLTDGATSFVAIDTRVATDNIAAVSITGSAPTYASAAGSSYNIISVPAVTLVLTGGVQVTALNGLALNLARPVVNSAAATTVLTASTLYIANSPSAGGAGPVSITNNYALHVAAGISAFAGNVLITANTLNFTAGGAFTLGTTDANTLIVKTGGTTRWTFAAASSNITAAGAADIIGQATTASMVRVTDGTTALVALDSRTAVDNTITTLFTSVAPTFVSAAGSGHSHVQLAVYTLTLTGGVGVTALDGLQLYVDAPTVTSAAATTITTASTMFIKPPVAAGAGPASFTNSRMINTSIAGCFLTSAGVWTSASSIDLKDHVMPIDLSLIPSLMDTVEVVTFRYKDIKGDTGRTRYGVIAEDVPDFLASQDHKGVAAIHVAGFTLAATKYLKAENDSLKAQVKELQERLERAGIA